MPNKYQLAFLASFFSVFFALVALSSFLDRSLRDAGYDYRRIILIGIDMTLYQFAESVIPAGLRSLDLPVVGTVDVAAVASSPTFLISTALLAATVVWTQVVNKARPKPLDPNEWRVFPLAKKIQVSPNTAIYRFSLPHAQDVLGLPIGQHISVSAEINGKIITRSYTPISSDDDLGRFDLIIKTYELGNISKHVAQLKIGDNVRVKGPKGNFKYAPNLVGHLSMIAGGTGIAPMLQIIRAALKNTADRTTITLIYANVSESDILLKADLDELAKVHAARFKIFYVLNNPPPGWTGGVGFVSQEHIKQHLPNPATTDSKLLICGPPPMVGAMKKNFEALKYPVPNTVSKLHDKSFVF